MRGSRFRSREIFEAVPVHESMHELPPWHQMTSKDVTMPRGGNVKTAELYRKKKSEAIESCFSRPTYELDIGRGSARTRDHLPALMLYVRIPPLLES